MNYATCFSALIHFIRLGLKESARTASEWKLIEHADAHGTKFDREQDVKEDLERTFYASWAFDCPICNGFESVVAELVEAKLDVQEVMTDRCACVQCGFIVGRETPYISPILLASGIAKDRTKILREFGILPASE